MIRGLQSVWRRWFGQAETESLSLPEEAPVHAPVAEPGPAVLDLPSPPPATLPVWKPALPINAMYVEWLLGESDMHGAVDGEQKVLLALYSLLASDLNESVVVPRMPAIIPQLLACMRQDLSAVQDLTRLIAKDAALLGEVINTVNSALYNPADRIDNLDNAVLMLGEEGLRYVIGKVAFRPIVSQHGGRYTRRAAPHIWSQSEKCALACRELTKPDAGFSPFLAFLTGLMNQVGLIIVFRLLDQQTGEQPFRYGASFHLAICAVAATLSYRIARRWNFPEPVINALQQQAGGRQVEWTQLGCLLHNADLISKMRLLYDHGRIVRPDHRMKAGLNVEEARCFDALPQLPLFELKPGV